MYKFLLLIIILTFLSSCDKKESNSVDKNIITIVNNTNEPSDPNFKISMKLLYSVDFNGFSDFREGGFRNYIEIDNDGNCYVYDYTNLIIKKYDNNGKAVTEFGGKGYGPGELGRHPEDVSSIVVNDDKLEVLSRLQKNRNYYDLNGKFIEKKIAITTVPYNRNLTVSNFVTTPIDSNTILNYILLFSKNEYIYKLNIIETENDTLQRNNIEIVNFREKKTTNPYATTALKYAYKDNKIYTAYRNTNEYKIEIYDTSGIKRKVINKKYRRRKYPEWFINVFKSFPNVKLRDFMFLDAINQIHIDKYSNIWISSGEDQFNDKTIDSFEKLEEKEKHGKDIIYQVFNSEGFYLNKIKIDAKFKPFGLISFENDKMVVLGNEGERSKLFVFDY